METHGKIVLGCVIALVVIGVLFGGDVAVKVLLIGWAAPFVLFTIAIVLAWWGGMTKVAHDEAKEAAGGVQNPLVKVLVYLCVFLGILFVVVLCSGGSYQ